MKASQKTRRLGEIIQVVTKYGFADHLPDRTPGYLKRWFTKPDGELLSNYTDEERFRMALTELGTTFIKLGQMLSSREALVGPTYAAELTKLQSGTPADPPEVVRATIESELGRPLEELYADFDLQAMGSASIGQVHAATLLDGTKVVIKVLHQGIEEMVRTDLELMNTLAEQLEKHGKDRIYQPKKLATEFSHQLLRELNLNSEARNLKHFIHNFHNDPAVVFPQPYPELSTSRVLTMTKIVGINLNDRERLSEENIDLEETANIGANIWIEMIFRDSFFHADPHPGNLLVLSGGRVGVLDCGMVGYIDDQTQEDLEDLVLAFAIKDVDQISDTILRICDAPKNFQRRPFTRDVSMFMADYLDQSIKDMDVSAMMRAVNDIAFRHHLMVPANLIMLGKAIAMLEGTSHLVYPEFDLNEALEPHYQAIVERRYSPKRLMAVALRSYKDWGRLLTSLPGEVGDILALLQQGEFRIQFEVNRLDKVANRLIYGLVVAALIVASAMIWSAGVGPMAGDISLLGAVGILFAIVLVIRLFRAVERSGGM
jgi:ubiquinone biosynthesis protein